MFEAFEEAIRADLDDLRNGSMEKAVELSAQTRQHFNATTLPMYFTGAPDARLILIHLNPKQPNIYAPIPNAQLSVPTFEQYWSNHKTFGNQMYGSSSPRTHKSPFDHKQIRFLRPFGTIPFVHEHTADDRFKNLELALDQKLQLELIPYGSATFNSAGFTPAILQPHMERILAVVAASPRDYVLFCGQVFELFLRDFITTTHRFKLVKKDGQPTQNEARFSNLEVEYQGQAIRAGLAHSFAQQGIPMTAYAQRCKEMYGFQ